ncbi:MAG: hypothetical protein IIZ34_03835 [Eubacterium sp.]|nr:hypothetical protein [Eubacterium sp.]
MGVSASIKALLSLREKKQSDLMEPLNMSSRQSLSNKFSGERWFASDLIKVAEVCGCRVAFILPDGQQINIEA